MIGETDGRPSARVRLEAALLDAEEMASSTPASGPGLGAALDEGVWPTVLVIAAEGDLRRYVRECLRERAELRVVEAASVPDAAAIAARHPPACLVVDERERDVLGALEWHRVVLLVDEVPRDAPEPTARLRLLARPFTARELTAEIDRLIG